jgi:hypothetical protein
MFLFITDILSFDSGFLLLSSRQESTLPKFGTPLIRREVPTPMAAGPGESAD